LLESPWLSCSQALSAHEITDMASGPFLPGLELATNFVFYSTQPDCLAALLGIAGLLVWLGRDASSLRYALALVLWLGAMLFKQTSAAFALVPLVHELIWNDRLNVNDS